MNDEAVTTLSNGWKKTNVLSGLFASILIPIAVLIIGNSYSSAIKQREIQAKYVELAINILNSKTSENIRTKDWAVKIINEYSDVKIDSLTQKEIIQNEFLGKIKQDEFIDMGVSRAKKGDYDAAISGYDLAIEKDSLNPEPYSLKGYALYRKKDYQNAYASLTKSLLLDKDYVWAHYNLGLVSWKLGDKARAMNEVETVLRTHPELKSYMKNDNEFNEFKSIPRFNELMN